jgi:hypothetical protein
MTAPSSSPDSDAVGSSASTQHTRVVTQTSSRRPSEATTQNFRLAPSVEDGIKAAVAGAAATTTGGRRRQKKWTVIKYFLRWTSLVICVGVVIGETFESIMNSACFGTIFGIIWVCELANVHGILVPQETKH